MSESTAAAAGTPARWSTLWIAARLEWHAHALTEGGHVDRWLSDIQVELAAGHARNRHASGDAHPAGRGDDGSAHAACRECHPHHRDLRLYRYEREPTRPRSGCVPIRRRRRNKAKQRRIQHHRRAVTGSDVGVLAGGAAGIAAWIVYAPSGPTSVLPARGFREGQAEHDIFRLRLLGSELVARLQVDHVGRVASVVGRARHGATNTEYPRLRRAAARPDGTRVSAPTPRTSMRRALSTCCWPSSNATRMCHRTCRACTASATRWPQHSR